MESFVGIDFSINSPALCHYSNHKYRFVSFSNTQGRDFTQKVPKAYSVHSELSEAGWLEWIQYNRRRKHEDYTVDQFQKIEDAHCLAQQITECIYDMSWDADKIHIGIEGYSYGSKGNSFIDLVAFNSTLRNALYQKLVLTREADAIKVFTPSQIKRHAGKGNANKLLMWEYFLKDVRDDCELRETELWKWCLKKPEKINGKGEVELEKPLDDLVDSFFVVSLLRETIDQSRNLKLSNVNVNDVPASP